MMTHNGEPCLSLLLSGHEQGADRELASHQRLVLAHGVSWHRGGEDDGAIHPAGKHSVHAALARPLCTTAGTVIS
jgi:hypothetical protein